MFKSRIPYQVTDLFVTCLAFVLRFLPRRLVLALGRGFGRSIGTLAARKDARGRVNFLGAGSTDPQRSCRRAWEQWGSTLFEMVSTLGRSPDRALAAGRIRGLECLVEAAERGRGVLLASGHIGNWELVSLAAARAGFPLAVIARPMKTRRLERRLVTLRRKGSVRTLFRGKPGTGVAALRWLARGGILGCMMDRSGNGRRLLVPFLGGGMNIPLGPAEIACRLNVPVVLGCAERMPDGTNLVTFRSLPTDNIRDPRILARIVGQALEVEVKAHPEQWFWIFRQQPCWQGEAAGQDSADSRPLPPLPSSLPAG